MVGKTLATYGFQLRVSAGIELVLSAGVPIVAVFTTELPLEVRPKLFEDVSGNVDADLHAKLRDRIADISIIRVITIRDGHCD